MNLKKLNFLTQEAKRLFKFSINLLKAVYFDFKSVFVIQKVRYKVTGECKKCGKCCKDIRMKGLDDPKDLKLTQFFIPMYKRFEIVGKDENGDLILACKLQNA